MPYIFVVVFSVVSCSIPRLVFATTSYFVSILNSRLKFLTTLIIIKYRGNLYLNRPTCCKAQYLVQ